MKELKENELRELLAKNIEVIEQGLVLLKKERFVPNELGTRGFIDLFAKDSSNHYVLIELKRSEASSREAIHEVLKYAEGVKSHLKIRDDEIRIIILSTEWRELLVPFSRFIADTTLAVKGLQLEFHDSKGIVVNEIVPLPINHGRLIAPWHDVNYYSSRERLETSIKEYEACYKSKNIKDFVLVTLIASEGVHDEDIENTRQFISRLQQETGNEHNIQKMNERLKELKSLTFMLYAAMQILSEEEYIGILKNDPALLEEAIEIAMDYTGEEKICYLHEEVTSMDPRPEFDHYEIGTPAKLQGRILGEQGWEIEKVLKYGDFAQNPLLTDEIIINELSGDSGTTQQKLKKRIDLSNKAHVSSAIKEIQHVLENNPRWKSNLTRIIQELHDEFPTSIVDLSIFNPSTGLLTIYHTVTKDLGILYLPTFSITAIDKGCSVMYCGGLMPEGAIMQFNDIIEKYYKGDLFGLLFTLTWGGYENRDTDILEDIGLVYRSFKMKEDANGGRSYFGLKDDRWKSISEFNTFSAISNYLQNNREMVSELVHAIDTHQISNQDDIPF